MNFSFNFFLYSRFLLIEIVIEVRKNIPISIHLYR